MRRVMMILLLVGGCTTPVVSDSGESCIRHRDGTCLTGETEYPDETGDYPRETPNMDCESLDTWDVCCSALECGRDLPGICAPKPGTCETFTCPLKNGEFTHPVFCAP
jgi:hypothetical protein